MYDMKKDDAKQNAAAGCSMAQSPGSAPGGREEAAPPPLASIFLASIFFASSFFHGPHELNKTPSLKKGAFQIEL